MTRAAERDNGAEISPHFAQANVHLRAAKEFRLGLIRLWQDADKPTPEVMAQRTEIPKSVFEIFLADQAMPLPSHREVEAILLGTLTNPKVQERWLERFAGLEQQRAEVDRERITRNRAAQGLPPLRPGDLTDLICEPMEMSRPLAAALEATTQSQLQAALGELRDGVRLSFQRLADVTETVPGDLVLSRSTAQRIEKGARMPTKEQVVAFAKACGQTPSELRLWSRATDRVAELAANGPDAVDSGQVEVSLRNHPVRYPFGKAGADQKVHNELRIQVTPKLKRIAYTATGLPAAALAGLVLAKSTPASPARQMLGLGIALGAGAALLQVRKWIDGMSDEQLKLFNEVLVRVAVAVAVAQATEVVDAIDVVDAMPVRAE